MRSSNVVTRRHSGVLGRIRPVSFRDHSAMAIVVRKLIDPSLENTWFEALRSAGFDPEVDGDALHLCGVWVTHGDKSVDLLIEAMTLDSHRILELRAPIRCMPANFATAMIAAAKGNGSCRLAKFTLEEITEPTNLNRAFTLNARFHLYADHLSAEEFIVMVSLFLKEVDEIDNELSTIMEMA